MSRRTVKLTGLPGIRTDEETQQLMGDLAQGDTQAFSALVDLYFDMIYSLAYSMMGNADDAEDACQEAFLGLVRAAPSLAPSTCLRSYLYRVCVNCCLDRLRRRSRQPTEKSTDELEELLSDCPDPLELTAQRQFRERIVHCLSELSPQQRAVFALCHFQGLTVSEVATVLGRAPGTVRTHLHRALTNIRGMLHGCGYDDYE